MFACISLPFHFQTIIIIKKKQFAICFCFHCKLNVGMAFVQV